MKIFLMLLILICIGLVGGTFAQTKPDGSTLPNDYSLNKRVDIQTNDTLEEGIELQNHAYPIKVEERYDKSGSRYLEYTFAGINNSAFAVTPSYIEGDVRIQFDSNTTFEPGRQLYIGYYPTLHYFTAFYYLENTIGQNSIEVYDMSGTRIKRRTLSDKRNELVFDTGNWKAGMYVIKLTSGNKVIDSRKLSIQ
ncbi:MAG: T9SS type A sorting domain-containing protein [Bacteroidales bacterium]|nr:T9SS type A sorting domain-containing protein [Bacteroidales bacterium]